MRRRDDGQITVMTIGFFLAIALLGVVVVNASQAFLERRELDNLADGAALAAADGLDEEVFYRSGEVSADTRTARDRVARYLAGSGAQITAIRTTDGSITVVLRRTIDLALAPPGFPAQTTITTEATSQLRSGP